MKEEQRTFLSYFVLSTNQTTRPRFVPSLTKMAEAEGSFKERFLETVRQFSVLYDKGSFSLDTREFGLACAYFCACSCASENEA